MPAVQHQLAFARPLAARVRGVRRPFRPSQPEGAYRLPFDISERLTLVLAPFRNRDAAYALAVFIARFWSAPGRVAGSFPIDRRALADHDGLELTEARVRGAIRTLEAVAYLERAIPPAGSRYKATEEGLHRKPVLYVFGSEYAPAFLAANKRARSARGADQRQRRPIMPASSPCPSTAIVEARRIISPKSKSEAASQVIMGEVRRESGIPAEPSAPTAVDLALQRLGMAIGGGGNGLIRERDR